MEPVRLRRSVIARLRVTGALELLSTFLVLGVALVASEVVRGKPVLADGLWDVVAVAVVVLLALPVRLAVWTEYVEADVTGLRWRSLFREDTVPAERIVRIDIAGIVLLGQRHRSDVLRVHHVNGRTRKVRASAWCSSRARTEWLEEVRRLWGGTAPFGTPPGPATAARW